MPDTQNTKDVTFDLNSLDNLMDTNFGKFEEVKTVNELYEKSVVRNASMDELDEVYSKWSDEVNMTASELEEWSSNPCSREASKDPSAVMKRNLRLLEKNKDEWTTDDIEDAKRTISFISRMRGMKPDDPRDGVHGCPSDWAISLLNWAYNPFDSVPDVPDDEDLGEVEKITMSGESEDSEDVEATEEEEMGAEEDIDNPKYEFQPVPTHVVYDDSSRAMERAENLGLEGVHEHDVDGETLYMPGSEHQDWLEVVAGEKDMSKHKKEDMSEAGEEESEDLAEEDVEVHSPVYDGTTTAEWDRPAMEDFAPQAESWDEVPEDEREVIEERFLVSKTGFPAENFGDLSIPVVEPTGELNVNALRVAKGGNGVPALDGVSDEDKMRALRIINDLAEEEFPDETDFSPVEEMMADDSAAEAAVVFHGDQERNGEDDEEEPELVEHEVGPVAVQEAKKED